MPRNFFPRTLLSIPLALVLLAASAAHADGSAPLARGVAGAPERTAAPGPLAGSELTPRDPGAPEESETGPRPLIGLGFGGGGLTGGGGQPATQTANFAVSIGMPLTEHLHALLDGQFATMGRSSDPTQAQGQSAVTLGLRWAPFEKRAVGSALVLDPTNFYVKAGLGFGLLDLNSYSKFWTEGGLHPGGAVSYGLGWLPFRRTGFAAGLELSGVTGFYAGQARQSYNLGFSVRFDL